MKAFAAGHLDWAWIDTCCIDKRSDAEVSEAINSMFSWYQNAQICLVYLKDVRTADADSVEKVLCLQQSEWFRRGWTLQELLAPSDVLFLGSDWQSLGHKCRGDLCLCSDPINAMSTGDSLNEVICNAPSIDPWHLINSRSLHNATIAQKMSWAAHRETTKVEAIAYCMLGLLGVNMPLLYGEGHRAFLRLQSEIIRTSKDQSFLAWHYHLLDGQLKADLLAPSPAFFKSCGNVARLQGFSDGPVMFAYHLSNGGLHMTQFAENAFYCEDSGTGVIRLPLEFCVREGARNRAVLRVSHRGCRSIDNFFHILTSGFELRADDFEIVEDSWMDDIEVATTRRWSGIVSVFLRYGMWRRYERL